MVLPRHDPAPSPILLQIAIETRDARDQPRLVQALAALAAEDAGCSYAVDPEFYQTVIGGGSEAHLEALVAALRVRFGLALKTGALHVAYRETITRRMEMDTTHKKRLGEGAYEFARVKLVLEPAAGWTFEASCSDGMFPAAFLAGVEAGLAIGRRAGVLAGFPVVDIKASLVDGAYHDTDSTPRAFEIAALTAFRHALGEVGVLLEPIMRVDLLLAAAFSAAARDDLLIRRGEIESRALREDGMVAFAANVPLANLLGYSDHVRQLSDRTGSVGLAFSHFSPMARPDPPEFPGAMALRIA